MNHRSERHFAIDSTWPSPPKAPPPFRPHWLPRSQQPAARLRFWLALALAVLALFGWRA